ncbi:hypothetical protein [Sphingomonas sp. KR3-1]|uniref:hypothetical protein n=1 Tax=Sphingomonas sp. KR3-1 TaxID=3156611 RepID=UPI0032B4BB20
MIRAALVLALLAGGAAAPQAKQSATLDLAKPFATRAPWRLTVVQGPDSVDVADNPEPGALTLCLSRDGGRSCSPDLSQALHVGPAPDLFDVPHYLESARIVHPAGGRALLLVQLASVHSGNGDQRVSTQLLAYDRAKDAFVSVYARRAGRNNNQEVRYVAGGPLQGAMISAEPTDDKPFGYWITVSKPDSALRYTQALRYRSATHYGDGNPLAVIDSEMPNIERRLGLWRPGMKLPLPARGCARPHLVNTVLWCD